MLRAPRSPLSPLAVLVAAGGGSAGRRRRSRRRLCRPTPPFTSRPSCGRRATCARTRSTPPARSWAPTTRGQDPRAPRQALNEDGDTSSTTSRTSSRGSASAPARGSPTARRGGRRHGRGGHRDYRRGRRAGGARAGARARSGDTHDASAPTRGTDYLVDEDGDAAGAIVDDFLSSGPEAAVQAHGRRAQGGRLARRGRRVHGRRATGSRTTASGTSRSTSGAARSSASRRAERRGAAAPVRRSCRSTTWPADGLVRGRRRPPRARVTRRVGAKSLGALGT